VAAPELRIGALTPLTSIDYPGELAAVVFCQGCPWRCRYCQNPELLPARGEQELPWPQLLVFLERRRGLLDAVVFSGGEPTLQADLGAALLQLKDLGFKLGLHSAGCYPERLERLLPTLDWVGLDLKAPEDDYARITGVPGSGAPAWDSARRLVASGVAHEIRITVHQDLLSVGQVALMLERLAGWHAPRLILQPCQPR
jgi:pyruvate formate lyase activating enzyme